MALLVVAGASWGYWTAALTGHGVASTGTLSAPAGVVAAPVAWHDQVQVTWGRASTSAPQSPAVGYYLTRVDASTGASAPACSTSASSPTVDAFCTDTGVPDGTYRYVVHAVHRTWSAASAPSAEATIRADTTPPTIAVTATSPAAVSTGWYATSPVTMTLHAQDGVGSQVASVSYSVDGSAPSLVPGDAATLVVSGDGAHTVTAQATDQAGNVSQPVSTVLRIDTVAPTVTIQHAPEQKDPTNQTPILFGAVFSETVTGFGPDDVQLSGPAGAATVEVTGGGATYQVAVSGAAADGPVTISVRAGAAQDAAGHDSNSSSTSPGSGAGDTVTLDTTAPAAPGPLLLTSGSDTGRSDRDRVTRARVLTLTGTAEPGTAVRVFSDGTPVASVSEVPAGGTYTATTAALAEGIHVLTAVATDRAGNAGPASSPMSVTIDTTAPVAPSPPDLDPASDSGSSSTDNVTTDSTPTFTGTLAGSSDPDALVTLLVDGTAAATGAAVAGSYMLTLPPLTDATHTVTATATDIAGNASNPSAPVTVTIDTLTPVVTLDAPTYTSSSGQVVATGTAGTAAGDASTITVVVCTSSTFPCSASNTLDTQTASVNPTTGRWTATSKDLRSCLLFLCAGPGTVYVQATQTDLAGHTGTGPVRSGVFP